MIDYNKSMQELREKIEKRSERLETAIKKLDSYSKDIGLVIASLGHFELEYRPKNSDSNIISFRYEFNESYKMQVHFESVSFISIIGSVDFDNYNENFPAMVPSLTIDSYSCSTDQTDNFVLGIEFLVDNIKELLSPMIEKALEK